VLQEIVPQMFTLSRWNFEGVKKFEMINTGVEMSTKIAQTGVGLYYERNSEIFAGVPFDNLWSMSFNINSRISDRVGYYFTINHGRGIARFAVAVGRETSVYAGTDLKPTDRIVVEPQLSYSKSLHRETGTELFKGYIARARVQYQANRALSFRLVTQYNDFARRWDIDPLLTYRLSPFSVFYLGSTHDYADLSARPHNPAQWRLSSRQIFMKLQYLFQV
jgi:hypothetical protein